jgi:FkbH-like protein
MNTGQKPAAFTIRILRNFTIEHIEPALKSFGEQFGLPVQVQFGAFDSVVQDILSLPESRELGAPDLVVVALNLDSFAGGLWTPGWNMESTKAALQNIFDLLVKHFSGLAIVNTFIPSFFISRPALGAEALGGRPAAVQELNSFIRSCVASNPTRLALVDWDILAMGLGEREVMDYRFGYMMKAPFKTAFLNAIGREIIRIARCLRNAPKKVLVADCDNTLWGGVIGEDGLEGIKLDPFTYPGVAYHNFQFDLLALREQGVLLCLCSKNNEADVWEVLERHPHCLLKREHLSGWRINWEDKAGNLEALALKLNLGLDSFVFIDDNPQECERVRQAMPQVTVVPIPEKLFELPRYILRQGLFDALTVSHEDRQRARLYREEARRVTGREAHQTLEQYLASLQMVADVHEMRPEELARVAQLTQRTNQFNLTTQRYSEADIGRFAADCNKMIFNLSVSDKFGELGLVGILIFSRQRQLVIVDSFLLSCRVIGRKLEDAFLAASLDRLAREWDFVTVRAAYQPTAKNTLVAGLWPAFGMGVISMEAGSTIFGATREQLRVTVPEFIRISNTNNDKPASKRTD